MRALRVKLDIGGWEQDERTATTVQVSVREDKGGKGSFQGVGVAISAPEDTPVMFTLDQTAAGVVIAAERAIRESGMPLEYADAVSEVVLTELIDRGRARKLGERYYRINRRVSLPAPSVGRTIDNYIRYMLGI